MKELFRQPAIAGLAAVALGAMLAAPALAHDDDQPCGDQGLGTTSTTTRTMNHDDMPMQDQSADETETTADTSTYGDNDSAYDDTYSNEYDESMGNETSAAARNNYGQRSMSANRGQADTWISIDGTVRSVDQDSFLLDYGNGTINVQMADTDRDADNYQLSAGDRVTVSGRVSNQLFDSRALEADNLYVQKLNTTFTSSTHRGHRTQQGWYDTDTTAAMNGSAQTARVSVQGTVSSVGADQFTIDNGARKVTIATDELGYDPLDDSGYQKIEIGDRVQVSGRFDSDFWTGRQLEADSVIELQG